MHFAQVNATANKSGSPAMLTAIFLASSLVSSLAVGLYVLDGFGNSRGVFP
jgi:hypothetical protein